MPSPNDAAAPRAAPAALRRPAPAAAPVVPPGSDGTPETGWRRFLIILLRALGAWPI